MNLSEEELDIIAEKLFQRLMKQQEIFEQENNTFIINDEFGNNRTVTELEYLHFELYKLEGLESKYVEDEEFEKANMIKNKIRHIKNKINRL